jgi:hypothetical protein
MDWWRVLKIAGGLICIGGGLFSKEFKPIGWTTALIWGRDENARILRWIAEPFYVALGLLMLYWGITNK